MHGQRMPEASLFHPGQGNLDWPFSDTDRECLRLRCSTGGRSAPPPTLIGRRRPTVAHAGRLPAPLSAHVLQWVYFRCVGPGGGYHPTPGRNKKGEAGVATIELDHAVCIVSGMCESVAPELFEVADDQSKVVVLRPDLPDELVGDAQNAAVCCPVEAITVLTG